MARDPSACIVRAGPGVDPNLQQPYNALSSSQPVGFGVGYTDTARPERL